MGSSSSEEEIIEVDESEDSVRRRRVEIESPSLRGRTRRYK